MPLRQNCQPPSGWLALGGHLGCPLYWASSTYVHPQLGDGALPKYLALSLASLGLG